MHGVGLGLFVAEGIVRSAGGRITVDTGRDRTGTLFTIILPAASPAQAAEVTEPA